MRPIPTSPTRQRTITLPERACDALLNATEAGPSSPGGMFRPELWRVSLINFHLQEQVSAD